MWRRSYPWLEKSAANASRRAGLLGGFVWARYWHFLSMLLLVILGVGHVFMVFTVGPYSIPAMITGRYREELSPETRNARPFIHLLPRDE